MESESLQFKLKNEVIDESFHHGMFTSLALLFTIDNFQFSYCIYDLNRRKIIVLRDYSINLGGKSTEFLKSIIPNDDILKNLKPEKIVAAIHSDYSVLIPEPLFSKEYAKEALSISCTPSLDDIIHDDKIKLFDAHIVYPVNKLIENEIKSYYFNAIIINSKTCFIEQQLMFNKHNMEEIISINVRKQNIDVVITKGNELLFCNTFTYFTGEDFIYYLLFVMEQLELSPDFTHVVLYGEIDKTSSSWLATHKYIRNCKFGDQQDTIEFAYGFEQLNKHQYHLLFSQQLCVS